MPRVVADQKTKFETDELFLRLQKEGRIRYAAYPNQRFDTRQELFIKDCYDGHTEIIFMDIGTVLELVLNDEHNPCIANSDVLIQSHDTVYITSNFIMNGVCVCFRGCLNIQTLEGRGFLEYDEPSAIREADLLREEIKKSYWRFLRAVNIGELNA